MSGQPQLGSNPFISMDCTVLDVTDPTGGPSNLIIRTTDAFQVSTRFELGGMFASWISGLPVNYTVSYYYEGIGTAPEGTLGTVGPQATVPGQLVYGVPETVLNVPAGALPAGTYMLTVVVSFGGSPPMTAFTEGPMIQVF